MPQAKTDIPIVDFVTVTESTGTLVTREALAMLFTRYRMAAERSVGKDVLEVACGSGQGLGYVARRACRIVGGDYSESLLRMARGHYGSRVPLVRLNAQALPFRDRSFDVVILYEAIYYLPQPERFLTEATRVLRPGGLLLISTVNREWPEFNPSPYSTRYFGSRELDSALRHRGFSVELYGAFLVQHRSWKERAIASLRRAAIAFHLIPKTMRGKAMLKRLVLGRLSPVPPEVEDGMAEHDPLVPLAGDSTGSRFKVLYAIARAGRS